MTSFRSSQAAVLACNLNISKKPADSAYPKSRPISIDTLGPMNSQNDNKVTTGIYFYFILNGKHSKQHKLRSKYLVSH